MIQFEYIEKQKLSTHEPYHSYKSYYFYKGDKA